MIQLQAFGPHEDLLTIVKKKQIAVVWASPHVSRSSRQSYKAMYKEKERNAGRKRGGKITFESGQA